MSIQDARRIVVRGLRALGVTSGRIGLHYWHDRATVELNGEYFGIWDFGRECFVD